MTGLDMEEANGWRKAFAEKISNDWFGYSKTPHVVNPCSYFRLPDGTPTWKEDKEYIRFELRQVRDCDLLVVAVSRLQDSIGTACEIATAYSCGKPILLYNPHRIPHHEIHPFVWEMSDGCFEDMDELAEYITEVYLI